MPVIAKIAIAIAVGVLTTYLEREGGEVMRRIFKAVPVKTSWARARQEQAEEDERRVQARKDFADAMLLSATDRLLDEIEEVLSDDV